MSLTKLGLIVTKKIDLVPYIVIFHKNLIHQVTLRATSSLNNTSMHLSHCLRTNDAKLAYTFSIEHPFIRRTRYEIDNHGHMWYCFHRKCALNHKDHRSFDSHKAIVDHIIHCHHHELNAQLTIRNKCGQVHSAATESLLFRVKAQMHRSKSLHVILKRRRRPMIDHLKSTQLIHRHMRWKL